MRYIATRSRSDGIQTGCRPDAPTTGLFPKADAVTPLSPTLTDANQLVKSMGEMIRRTIGPQIELDVAATDNLWITQVDPNQLENALLNLGCT